MNGVPEEPQNVQQERPDQRPPAFGLTVVADPGDASASDFLGRLRDAWSVIAGWGRWSDEELGDWPENAEVLDALPEPLRQRLGRLPEAELESWTDDLHDRDWIWWSGAVVGGRVKLDLHAFSRPVSLQPLKALIGWFGGTVEWQGDWIPSQEVPAQVSP